MQKSVGKDKEHFAVDDPLLLVDGMDEYSDIHGMNLNRISRAFKASYLQVNEIPNWSNVVNPTVTKEIN